MASRRERQARAGTTAIFFMTGWVYAAWATRIPAVTEQLGLSAGELALAILGLEAGAIGGLPAGAALVARAGSRRALQIGFVIYPAALVGIALSPGLAALAAALAAMAAASSVVDVAMNAQGVELERRYERPILSGLHAGHPFGLAAGGLAGAAAAAAGVPVGAHFAAAAGIGLVSALAATALLVSEPSRAGRSTFVRPSGRLLLVGLIAFCAFLLDGAAYNWSAVHLRNEHAATAGVAATAFTLFSIALAVGRLFGDGLVARFGRVRVVQGCGAVAAAGSAIAAVITVGYLGSFTGPPAIGALAELSGLSAALGLLVAVSLMMLVLARPALREPGAISGAAARDRSGRTRRPARP